MATTVEKASGIKASSALLKKYRVLFHFSGHTDADEPHLRLLVTDSMVTTTEKVLRQVT